MTRSYALATFLALALATVPMLAFAQAAPAMRVERTPNYTLTLDIGHAEPMMSAVMADEGMEVNHHLEVHIMQGDTDVPVTDVIPTIRITDKMTGVMRELPQVVSMMDPEMGMQDVHFGQNLWLPDGTYNVTVMVGTTDTALFRDVQVVGSPMMDMSGGTGMAPATSMPTP